MDANGKFTKIFTVRCSGELHHIALTKNKTLAFLDHPIYRFKAENALSGNSSPCSIILKWMRGLMPSDEYNIPKEIDKYTTSYMDKIRKKRSEIRAHHKDPLVVTPLRIRIDRRIEEILRKCLRCTSYRESQSRWAGGRHFYTITPNTVVGSRPDILGRSEKVFDGKWSGNNSEIIVRVNLLDWYRVYSATGGGLADTKNGKVIILDIIKKENKGWWVHAGKQGRGFNVESKTGLFNPETKVLKWKEWIFAKWKDVVESSKTKESQSVAQ